MVKFDVRRRVLAVQLILVAVNFFPVEVNGGVFNGIKQIGGSVARSVASVPSRVMDGGQVATHVVARGLGRITSPVKPLQSLVNAGGGAVSNALGSTSRLLGKRVPEPQSVMFLYARPLDHVGGSLQFRETVRTVLGYALHNVVLHADDMADDGAESIELKRLPTLRDVALKLKKAGAADEDVFVAVRLLGRNGKADLPRELKDKVIESLIDPQGRFRSTGAIDELHFITDNENGYYMLDDQERTDYKLKTNNEYSSCTRLYTPFLKNRNTKWPAAAGGYDTTNIQVYNQNSNVPDYNPQVD